MQLPLAGGRIAEALRHPDRGFEVQLFAAEPDLGGKPIAMNWDERGRLWVCETVDYPNELQPPGGGRDRIRILRRHRRRWPGRQVHASSPRSSAFRPPSLCARGGVIVQNGTETLFLKDTDGDDMADVREVLISGWTLGDTHGGVSNFRYGLDNWIWAMQGYNNSTPKFGGTSRQCSLSAWASSASSSTSDPPRVTDLEFLRSTNNNTWGLGISEEGLIFGSTANSNPSVYMPIPNRYYERVRGWSPRNSSESIADSNPFQPITDKVRQVDQHGGYTAGAGHALYTARNYPQQYWNRTAFVCGPTGHLVGTFVLEARRGRLPLAQPLQSRRQRRRMVGSDHGGGRPRRQRLGHRLVQLHRAAQPHAAGFETGKGNAYETDLRDKKHGRIYRVVSRSNDAMAELSSMAHPLPADLVDQLCDPTMLRRLQAQRLLVERGDHDIVPQLLALLDDETVDAIGLNPGVIHALWTLHGLGVIDSSSDEVMQAVIPSLQHPSAGVRRNAVQVLPDDAQAAQVILDSGRLSDPDPQVQLATLLKLADLPPGETTGRQLAQKLRDSRTSSDRWLVDALTSAAAVNAIAFLRETAQSTALSSPDAGVLRSVAIVAEHLARSQPSSAELNSLLSALDQCDLQIASVLLEGLSRGWNDDHMVELDDASNRALGALLERLPVSDQGKLIRLAKSWGSREFEAHFEKIAQSMLQVLSTEDSPPADRITAAKDWWGCAR